VVVEIDMARMLAGVVLLFFFGTLAFAEDDVELWIVCNIRDMTVEKAIGIIADVGDVQVTVEKGIAKRKVTLEVDHRLVGALQAIAEEAGAYLWKLDEGRYAVRAKAPPPSSVPPEKETSQVRDDGPTTAIQLDPKWVQEIQRALDETTYEGTFKDTPLPDFLAALARLTGVPFDLDPEVLRTRSKKELEVDFEDYLGGSSVWESLMLYCGTSDLAHCIRWGAVFVGTFDRTSGLPEDVFASGREDLPEPILRALGRPVSCRLKKLSLSKAIALLAKKGGLAIEIDPVALKHTRRHRISVRFEDRKLEDALSFVLIPSGLALRVVEGELRVGLR